MDGQQQPDHVSRTAPTVQRNFRASKGRSWKVDRQTEPRGVTTNERRPSNQKVIKCQRHPQRASHTLHLGPHRR
ncbi:hypothetical protein J6590_020902 [Homalodisca vitripennis]|nr:hypothetical protein J6590_020902 [Homalodisca vitripennis]